MIALVLILQTLNQTQIHLSVDGVDRTANVYAPTVKQSAKHPVFIFYHGHGDTAEGCEKRFRIEDRWPNAVIVYPQGLPVPSLGQSAPGWDVLCNEKNRDVKFFDALRAKVIQDFNGDPERLFTGGFSNGGIFMYTLWTMRADKIAAFCCSGAYFALDDVQLQGPKPAFVTISGNDDVIPTADQEKALEQVLKTNGASGDGSEYGSGGKYFRGKQPVVVWRYDGGHEFPFDSFPTLIKFFNSVANAH